MNNKSRVLSSCLTLAFAMVTVSATHTQAAPSPASAKETAALREELKQIENMVGDPHVEGVHPDKRMVRKQIGPQAVQQITPQFEKMTEFAAKSDAAESMARIDLLYYTARLAYWGQSDQLDALKKMSASEDPAIATRGKIGWNFFTWIDADQDHNRTEELDALAGMQTIATADPKNLDTARSMVFIVQKMDICVKAAHGLNLAVAGMKSPFALAYTKSPDRIGEPVEFTGKALKGPDVSTTKWKGKVVMVDFWATWCPPCRAAIPEVVEWYKKYHDQGFEVLGVSSDSDRKDLTTFLTTNPDMVWPELFTANSGGYWHPLTKKFDINGIPTSFLIDRNGLLREREYGRPLKVDLIEKVLAEKDDTAS